MTSRPAKGQSYPMVGLPNPPPGMAADPSVVKHLQDLNVVLARELSARPKKNEVAQLLAISPNGSLWQIVVADDGTISTVPLFTQT